MARGAHMVGQRVRLCKGGIVGLEELLEYAAGHERSLPLSRCVMRPCAFPSGPSLPCPPASSPDLTTSSIAAEAISSNGWRLSGERKRVRCSRGFGARLVDKHRGTISTLLLGGCVLKV